MMSLLLTFFVLLFSMSELKREESMLLLESLRRRFGNQTAPLSVMPVTQRPTAAKAQRHPSLARARRADTHSGGDRVRAPVGDFPRVQTVRPSGEVIEGAVVFFAPGEANLSEEARRTLAQLLDQIAGKPQKLEVRGHSSGLLLPPDSPRSEPRLLAFQRAVAVADFLIAHGIEKERLRIAVAGQSEPLATPTRPETAHLNDRVELLMLEELVDDHQPQAVLPTP
jgi:chemotaxis protein MotB